MQTAVVIPVRNEEQLITQSLVLLLRQTRLPKEVIVVNNNSTDQTVIRVAGMQQSYREKGIVLKILHCPTGTQATARERGVAAAASELVAFIDADTVLPLKWIERGQRMFELNEALVGTGGPMIYQQWAMTLTNFFLYCYVNTFRSRYFFYGCNGLFRTSAYKKCAGLAGCDEFMAAHEHQEPYDDVWLSQRLRRVGIVHGSRQLVARGQIRIGGTSSTLRGAYQRWLRQRRETAVVLEHLHHERLSV